MTMASCGDNITVREQRLEQQTGQVFQEELGIIADKPKLEKYARLEDRLKTFEEDDTPFTCPVDMKSLAEAGFVCRGDGDTVVCFYCNLELRNWKQGDVPMKEHARWRPKCPHLILVKGKDYIEMIQKTIETSSSANEGLKSDDASGSVETTSDDNDSSGPDSYGSSGSNSDELEMENKILVQNSTCKICNDAQADIVFLPCVHLMTCGMCAPSLRKCPECRKNITGLIKTYSNK